MNRFKLFLAAGAAALFGALVLGGCGSDGDDGYFTDRRDGKKYRTVKMPDGRVWMAENLNFTTPRGSWCFGEGSGTEGIHVVIDNEHVTLSSADVQKNCDTYGRLYDWNVAMTACPAGWRLPYNEEWSALINAVGGDEVAGGKLKSRTGWKDWDGRATSGNDDFGFSALPGGERSGDLDDTNNYAVFSGIGVKGHWWSASDNGIGYYLDNAGSVGVGGSTYYEYSVRCIKIEKETPQSRPFTGTWIGIFEGQRIRVVVEGSTWILFEPNDVRADLVTATYDGRNATLSDGGGVLGTATVSRGTLTINMDHGLSITFTRN